MATTRKDLRGRTLRKGEMQRSSDKRYAYSYKDPLGRRRYIYAKDLVTLREKEAQLMKDQLDGLDVYVAGKATVNFVFDRYMSIKTNLRQSTRSNYLYMYGRFIRDTFGRKNIAAIKYSDVLQFYNYLLEKQKLQINTLESIHTLLHPTFQLAVRDEIIRLNPTDGVMAEVKKASELAKGTRHALTIAQQRAFMEHIANHPVFHQKLMVHPTEGKRRIRHIGQYTEQLGQFEPVAGVTLAEFDLHFFLIKPLLSSVFNYWCISHRNHSCIKMLSDKKPPSVLKTARKRRLYVIS